MGVWTSDNITVKSDGAVQGIPGAIATSDGYQQSGNVIGTGTAASVSTATGDLKTGSTSIGGRALAESFATGDLSVGPTILPDAPAEDVELDAIFQALIVGLTGLDGSLVRPRWQPSPPKIPEPNITWIAVGVLYQGADDGPAIVHDPTGNGSDVYMRHEQIDVLVTVYGPRSQAIAALLRDDIAMPQNTEALVKVGIRWVSCGPIRQAPELVNQQWIRRQDLVLGFRRKVTRVYGTLNIEIAPIHLFDDTAVSATIVVPPGSHLEQ